MSQRAIPTSVAIIENRIGLGESASAERARSTRDLNEIGGGGRRMKKKKRGERFFQLGFPGSVSVREREMGDRRCLALVAYIRGDVNGRTRDTRPCDHLGCPTRLAERRRLVVLFPTKGIAELGILQLATNRRASCPSPCLTRMIRAFDRGSIFDSCRLYSSPASSRRIQVNSGGWNWKFSDPGEFLGLLNNKVSN